MWHRTAVKRRPQHHRSALGEPIALADCDAEGFFDLVGQFLGDRRGANDQSLKVREVETANQLAVPQHHGKGGRHAARNG